MSLQEEGHQSGEPQSNLWLPALLLLPHWPAHQQQQLHHHQLQRQLSRNSLSQFTQWCLQSVFRFPPAPARCPATPRGRRRTASSRPSAARTTSSTWVGLESNMRNTLMCSWRTVTTSGRESGHPGGARRGQDRPGETSLRSVMLHPYTGKMNDFQWF